VYLDAAGNHGACLRAAAVRLTLADKAAEAVPSHGTPSI
jgi:hypothetical protein